METAWMALDAADPQARPHVKCLSHGEWNETHGAADHGGHSYDDAIDFGCQCVQIPDQNGNLGETDMSDWGYLREFGDPTPVMTKAAMPASDTPARNKSRARN
jgi:hypothetical protein